MWLILYKAHSEGKETAKDDSPAFCLNSSDDGSTVYWNCENRKLQE